MADVELVIKIPEILYIKGFENIFSEEEKRELIISIGNGTLLPKGHGRLIILSEDAIKREQTPLSFSCQNWISEVGISNATVAIIEADRSEE